jgi:hypothetical protein
MGWWRSDRSTDDLVGDGPADAVTAALRSASRSDAHLSLQELLDALAHVLRYASKDLVEAREPAQDQIAAVLTDPAGILQSGTTTPRPQVANSIEGALHAIAAEYRKSLDRLPRRSEVLATFAFVLRPAADRFLRDRVQIGSIQ